MKFSDLLLQLFEMILVFCLVGIISIHGSIFLLNIKCLRSFLLQQSCLNDFILQENLQKNFSEKENKVQELEKENLQKVTFLS